MNRDELFDKHLRGELSEVEAAELKRLLATDTEAGRAFVEHVGETALFIRVGSQLQSTQAPENVVPFEPLEGQATRVPEPSSPMQRGTQGTGPFRAWQLAALAACLFVLGVVAVLMNRRPPARLIVTETSSIPTPAVYVTGAGVQVSRNGSPMDAGKTELRAGDVITAPSNEAATIVYRLESTRIELQPGAVLVFGEATQGKRFELLTGIVFARVAPQPAGQPLRIKTLHARATVLGTEFLMRTDERVTRLDVLDGKVQLNCRVSGKKVVVKSGFGATVQAGKASFDTMPLCKSNCILRECRSPDAASKLETLKSDNEQ